MVTYDFTGKKVLVTGGSRGIGAAIALAFAKAGATVAISFVTNEVAAMEVIENLPGEGHCAIQCDLSQPEDARQLGTTAITSLRGLDVLVNNAGVFLEHAPLESDWEKWYSIWQQTISTNLDGPAHLTFTIAEHWCSVNQSGTIINITSRGAYRGEPNHPAYGASKAALNSFSQSMAQHLAPQGIYVYGIAPGFVYTDMTAELLDGPEGEAILSQSPLNRAADPTEIASACLWLSTESCTYATGAILDINGASYLR